MGRQVLVAAMNFPFSLVAEGKFIGCRTPTDEFNPTHTRVDDYLVPDNTVSGDVINGDRNQTLIQGSAHSTQFIVCGFRMKT